MDDIYKQIEMDRFDAEISEWKMGGRYGSSSSSLKIETNAGSSAVYP